MRPRTEQNKSLMEHAFNTLYTNDALNHWRRHGCYFFVHALNPFAVFSRLFCATFSVGFECARSEFVFNICVTRWNTSFTCGMPLPMDGQCHWAWAFVRCARLLSAEKRHLRKHYLRFTTNYTFFSAVPYFSSSLHALLGLAFIMLRTCAPGLCGVHAFTGIHRHNRKKSPGH